MFSKRQTVFGVLVAGRRGTRETALLKRTRLTTELGRRKRTQ